MIYKFQSTTSYPTRHCDLSRERSYSETITIGIDERINVHQYTPIFWAVIRDNKRMFYKLLEQGADVQVRVNSPNRRAWWNWTLLHIAAQNIIEEDLEVSIKLLDLGEQT